MMKYLTFLFFLFLAGCTTVHEWNYTPSPAKTAKPESKIILLHPDLHDARPAYQMPVEGTFAGAKLRPVSQFARAAAAELSSTGYFQAVNHTDDADFYNAVPDNAMILQGELKRADLNLSDYRASWGIIGLPFWLIGAPYGKTENILEIHYRLRDKTSRVLFEKNYAAKNGRYNGYYYHPVEAEFEPLVRQISLELAEDLKNYFSENPSAL